MYPSRSDGSARGCAWRIGAAISSGALLPRWHLTSPSIVTRRWSGAAEPGVGGRWHIGRGVIEDVLAATGPFRRPKGYPLRCPQRPTKCDTRVVFGTARHSPGVEYGTAHRNDEIAGAALDRADTANHLIPDVDSYHGPAVPRDESGGLPQRAAADFV